MAQMTEETTRLQGKSNFPASKKVYEQGSRPDLLVPFREVALTPTSGRFGIQQNPPMRLYDTSGPYTDDAAVLDVRQGLPPCARTGFSNGATSKRPTESLSPSVAETRLRHSLDWNAVR